MTVIGILAIHSFEYVWMIIKLPYIVAIFTIVIFTVSILILTHFCIIYYLIHFWIWVPSLIGRTKDRFVRNWEIIIRWLLAILLIMGMIIKAKTLLMLVIYLTWFSFKLFKKVPIVIVDDKFAPFFLLLMHCIIILFRYFIKYKFFFNTS